MERSSTKLCKIHDRLVSLSNFANIHIFGGMLGGGIYFLSLHAIKTQMLLRNEQNLDEHGALNEERHLNPAQAMTAGSAARAIVTVTTIPITVVKTRFEAFTGEKYRGILSTLRRITMKEGFRSKFFFFLLEKSMRSAKAEG